LNLLQPAVFKTVSSSMPDSLHCLPGRSCTCGVSYVAVFKTAVSRCCTTGRFCRNTGITTKFCRNSPVFVAINWTNCPDKCPGSRTRTYTGRSPLVSKTSASTNSAIPGDVPLGRFELPKAPGLSRLSVPISISHRGS
jgi:hypothetical protein